MGILFILYIHHPSTLPAPTHPNHTHVSIILFVLKDLITASEFAETLKGFIDSDPSIQSLMRPAPR